MARQLLKKGSLLLIQGVDSSMPGEYIADNAAPDTENLFVDRGIVTKRAGTTQAGNTMRIDS